jgi:hypothetical protein
VNVTKSLWVWSPLCYAYGGGRGDASLRWAWGIWVWVDHIYQVYPEDYNPIREVSNLVEHQKRGHGGRERSPRRYTLSQPHRDPCTLTWYGESSQLFLNLWESQRVPGTWECLGSRGRRIWVVSWWPRPWGDYT